MQPGHPARCQNGRERRIRPDLRSAASLPQRSQSSQVVANPRLGCSRRCSRIRMCRTRCRGRPRSGQNAHFHPAARTSRAARVMTFLSAVLTEITVAPRSKQTLLGYAR